MTGVDADSGQGGERRRPADQQAVRRGVGLVAQLRGPTRLTSCDGIPWTLAGQSAAAEALTVVWVVVAELARERRQLRDAANGDPEA